MAGLAQELLGRLPLIAVAGAMGSVLADVQLLAHLGRQRVGVGRGGMPMWKDVSNTATFGSSG